MIACYAWTDTQIINMIQTLRTVFPGQSADLYVLKLDRISDSLLSAIEKSAFFRSTTLLPIGPELRFSNPLVQLPGLKTISLGRQYDRFFAGQLERRPYKESYNELLIPGFWAETLHIFRALTPDTLPALHFVEEGMYSYVRDSFRCRIDVMWKERLERMLRYGGTYRRARRQVRDIFLYRPEDMEILPDLPRRKIPPIDTAEPFWQSLFREMIPAESLRLYQERDFIFLSGALKTGYETTPARTEELLRLTAEAVGADRVVMRPHPSFPLESIEKMDGSYAATDCGRYWFEGIAALVDLDRKVIIARNSSVLQMIMEMRNFPRAVILTYKMYDFYARHGDPLRDKLAEKLAQNVPTYVPESRDMLSHILLDMLV